MVPRFCSGLIRLTSARQSSSFWRNAACRVANADELKLKLQEDLDDPEAAATRAAAGRSFVLAQHGASGRTLAELDRLVESSFTQKSA